MEVEEQLYVEDMYSWIVCFASHEDSKNVQVLITIRKGTWPILPLV